MLDCLTRLWQSEYERSFPRSTSLSTQIVPPCASAANLQKVNPKAGGAYGARTLGAHLPESVKYLIQLVGRNPLPSISHLDTRTKPDWVSLLDRQILPLFGVYLIPLVSID